MHDSSRAEFGAFSDLKAQAFEIKFSFWLDSCLAKNDDGIFDGLGSRAS